MPELPEIETIKRGLSPLLVHKTISSVTIRCNKLRYPLDNFSLKEIEGKTITHLDRRAKYLIIHLNQGTLLVHLGMSGQLLYYPEIKTWNKHDHIDIFFTDDSMLRYHDPRRFGTFERYPVITASNPRLAHLGPEPLSLEFNAQYLYKKAANKKLAIKQFLMNQEVVVGVGNIYAQEALFKARIHPQRPSNQVSVHEFEEIIHAIKSVLNEAIKQGGTTLKDFRNSDGKPGYFAQSLAIYGREATPCITCNTLIKRIIQAGRSTAYCSTCQI